MEVTTTTIQSASFCQTVISSILENTETSDKALEKRNTDKVIKAARKRQFALLGLNGVLMLGLVGLIIASFIDKKHSKEIDYGDYAASALAVFLGILIILNMRHANNKFSGMKKHDQSILKTQGKNALLLSKILDVDIENKHLIQLTKKKLAEAGKRVAGYSDINQAFSDLKTISVATTQANYLIHSEEMKNDTFMTSTNFNRSFSTTTQAMTLLRLELHKQHAKQISLNTIAFTLLIPSLFGPAFVSYLPIPQSDGLRYGTSAAGFVCAIAGIFLGVHSQKMSLRPNFNLNTNAVNQIRTFKNDLLELFPKHKDQELISLVLHEIENNLTTFSFYSTTTKPAQAKQKLAQLYDAVEQANIYAFRKLSLYKETIEIKTDERTPLVQKLLV